MPNVMNCTRYLIIIFVFVLACKTERKPEAATLAITGATIIDGSGRDPIRNGVMLLQQGRVVTVGSADNVTIPAGAEVKDFKGKTIIPGIINGHGHVGETKGIEGGHYSHENIIDNLRIYANYGVTTVVSLGGDQAAAEQLRHVHDTTASQHARLFIAGAIVNGKTSEEAVAKVDSNHHLGVDVMKIRVDDNLGAATKMPEQIYQAVIGRAHGLGYKVASHMYYLEDARKLIQAGSDILAHSIRDVKVDESFVKLIKEKNVGYCPTLTRELSTFVYGDTAEFFSDPFFTRMYDSVTIAPLKAPAFQLKVKESKSAKTYKQQLAVAMTNLKMLSDQGVPIIFGTDSGVPTRFIGYFEHIEMKMMNDAGITPMQIIVSASKTAAEQFGMSDLGTLAPGHWADFIVLDADPLIDIRNTTSIFGVFIAGQAVNRLKN
jgi:imidazolonepropionase-like amidohydrolase